MVVIEKINRPTNEKKLTAKQVELLNNNKKIFEGINDIVANNQPNNDQKVTTSNVTNQEINNIKNQENDNVSQLMPLLDLLKNKDNKSITELIFSMMLKDNPLYSKIFELMKLNANEKPTSSKTEQKDTKKEDSKISSFTKTNDIKF